MFVGHLAVGFAAKRIDPRTSLGTLLLAATWVDLIWPVLLLTGLEIVRIVPEDDRFVPLAFVHYPISHSLLMAIVWAVVVGSAVWLIARSVRSGVVVGACVASHWVIDFISHRPDLPLAPGIPLKVGLGLWDYPVATFLVEGAMFIAGVAIYVRTTDAIDRTGTWSLISLVALLAAIWVGNYLGPPPPSDDAIAWVGLSQWLIVAWGVWIDRHREAAPRDLGTSGHVMLP